MTMEKEDLRHVVHAQAQLIDFLSKDRAKKERELHNVKQILTAKVQEVRRDFRKLEPKLAQNRKLILKLILDKILDYPEGLTYNQIQVMFTNRYGYTPTIDRRIRELREQGLVRTIIRRNRVYVFPNLIKKEEDRG